MYAIVLLNINYRHPNDRKVYRVSKYSLVLSQRATAHTLQTVSEVNRERSRLAAASSVFDLTKHNGLVTICYETIL